MDILKYILIGFICFVVGLFAGFIVSCIMMGRGDRK